MDRVRREGNLLSGYFKVTKHFLDVAVVRRKYRLLVRKGPPRVKVQGFEPQTLHLFIDVSAKLP